MKRSVLVVLVTTIAACGGGGGSNTPPTGPTPPANPFTFTISANGVDPKVHTVPPGTRVLFVNNSNRTRLMSSDPHPEHTDCREINLVALRFGERMETLNLNDVGTCGFHDHDDPDNASVKGRIIIRP